MRMVSAVHEPLNTHFSIYHWIPLDTLVSAHSSVHRPLFHHKDIPSLPLATRKLWQFGPAYDGVKDELTIAFWYLVGTLNCPTRHNVLLCSTREEESVWHQGGRCQRSWPRSTDGLSWLASWFCLLVVGKQELKGEYTWGRKLLALMSFSEING